jgi:hypothetical protein
MCNCKNTPLQKVEGRIASRGWGSIANSELKLIDQFILLKLGLVPSNPQERIDMYGNAKSIK